MCRLSFDFDLMQSTWDTLDCSESLPGLEAESVPPPDPPTEELRRPPPPGRDEVAVEKEGGGALPPPPFLPSVSLYAGGSCGLYGATARLHLTLLVLNNRGQRHFRPASKKSKIKMMK